MKTKSFWTCCLAATAIAVSFIPLMAQDTPDVVDETDPSAQRVLNDARSALTAVQPRKNLQSSGFTYQQPAAGALAPSGKTWAQPLQSSLYAPGNYGVVGTPALFPGQNRFSSFSPELAKVINDSHEGVAKLIQDLKKAEADEDKQEIKAKIKEELETQYDAYLTHHEKPLQELEDRLAKLRDEFEARKKAKDDLVKLRLDTIWYDSLGLGWPRQSGSSFFYQGRNFMTTQPDTGNPLWHVPPATARPAQPARPPSLQPRTDATDLPDRRAPRSAR